MRLGYADSPGTIMERGNRCAGWRRVNDRCMRRRTHHRAALAHRRPLPFPTCAAVPQPRCSASDVEPSPRSVTASARKPTVAPRRAHAESARPLRLCARSRQRNGGRISTDLEILARLSLLDPSIFEPDHHSSTQMIRGGVDRKSGPSILFVGPSPKRMREEVDHRESGVKIGPTAICLMAAPCRQCRDVPITEYAVSQTGRVRSVASFLLNGHHHRLHRHPYRAGDRRNGNCSTISRPIFAAS